MATGPMIPDLDFKVKSDSIGAPIVAGNGDAWGAVASALDRGSARLGAMADKAASREGEAAGLLAGADPEFRPRNDGTIRGEAFDRAALRTLTVKTDERLVTGLAALATQHPDDGRAFQAGADALRKQYVESLPDDLRPEFEGRFSGMRLGYERDYVRLERKRLDEQSLAEALPLLDRRTKEIGRNAYQLGLDGVADKVLSGEIQALAASLIEYGPKTAFSFGGREFEADESRAGVLSLPDIQKQLIAANETIGMNRVKGAFDRVGTPKSRAEFAAGFRADYASGDGVASTMDIATVETLERYMGQTIREDEQAARAAQVERNAQARETAALLREMRSDLKGDLSDYSSYAREGLVPGENALQDLANRARELGDQDLLDDVKALAQTTGLVRIAAQSHPIQVRNEINQRRADLGEGADPRQAEELLALESTLGKMETELTRDPLSFAARAGIVAPLPLDLSTPETMAASFEARRKDARVIAETYGVSDALFTDSEATQFKAIEALGGEPLVELATTLVGQMGEDAPRALAKISEHAPQLAQMGGLLYFGGNPETVRDAARGRELVKTNPGVTTGLSAATSGLRARTKLAGIEVLPGLRAETERLANSIYVGRVGLNAEYDSAAYDRALQEALGARFAGGRQFGGLANVGAGAFSFNGDAKGTMMVPSWMRADYADEVLGGLRLDDLPAVPTHDDGTELTEAELRRAFIMPSGPGKVYLSRRAATDAEPGFFAGPDGLYELDINALKPMIAERWPEAVRP